MTERTISEQPLRPLNSREVASIMCAFLGSILPICEKKEKTLNEVIDFIVVHEKKIKENFDIIANSLDIG
jgi:hypothetical protein